MTNKTQKKTHGFQAEVKQILKLVIHSLYSNREIFLRELISNSSDATDKLRFLAIAHPEYLTDASELKIEIRADKKKRTLSVKDFGVGMTEEEVIHNLGTIAKSGTKAFLDSFSSVTRASSSTVVRSGWVLVWP